MTIPLRIAWIWISGFRMKTTFDDFQVRNGDFSIVFNLIKNIPFLLKHMVRNSMAQSRQVTLSKISDRCQGQKYCEIFVAQWYNGTSRTVRPRCTYILVIELSLMIVIDHKMSVYTTFRWVLGRFGKGLAFTNLQARSEGCLWSTVLCLITGCWSH